MQFAHTLLVKFKQTFFQMLLGVPNLATLLYMNELGLDTGIDPGMTLAPFSFG